MDSNDATSLRLGDDANLVLSAPSHHDDKSASIASAALESSVASSTTTIASSSLSTFSQGAVTDTAEPAGTRDGGDAAVVKRTPPVPTLPDPQEDRPAAAVEDLPPPPSPENTSEQAEDAPVAVADDATSAESASTNGEDVAVLCADAQPEAGQQLVAEAEASGETRLSTPSPAEDIVVDVSTDGMAAAPDDDGAGSGPAIPDGLTAPPQQQQRELYASTTSQDAAPEEDDAAEGTGSRRSVDSDEKGRAAEQRDDTVTQLPNDAVPRARRPSKPETAARHVRHHTRRRHSSSSFSGPRTPATASLANSGTGSGSGSSPPLLAAGGRDTHGAHSPPTYPSSATTSPQAESMREHHALAPSLHRSRMQLDAAPPSLIVVDAPMVTERLVMEVASTHTNTASSSPSAAESTSDAAVAVPAERDGADVRDAPSASAASHAVSRVRRHHGGGRRKAMEQQGSSWSTPLFTTSEDDDDGVAGEEEREGGGKEDDGEAGQPSTADPQGSPAAARRSSASAGPSPSLSVEEGLVGATRVVTVARPPVAQLTATEAQPPAEAAKRSGAAHSTTPPPALPVTSLSAYENEARVVAPTVTAASTTTTAAAADADGAGAVAALTPPPPLPSPPPAPPVVTTAATQTEQHNEAPPTPASQLPAPPPLPAASTSPLSASHERGPSLTSPPEAPAAAAVAAASIGSGGAAAKSDGVATSSSPTPRRPSPVSDIETGSAAASASTPAPQQQQHGQHGTAHDFPLPALRATTTTTTTTIAATNTPLISRGDGNPYRAATRGAAENAVEVRSDSIGSASTSPVMPGDSVESSSMAGANSWTLESAGVAGPRLSISGGAVTMNGTRTALTMAQFTNQSTLSAEGSRDRDRSNRNRHNNNNSDDNDDRSSDSYSYSYTASYSYYTTDSDRSVSESAGVAGSAATVTQRPQRLSGHSRSGDGDAARVSDSFSSYQHQGELSGTRVGLTEAGQAESRWVRLVAYEEVDSAVPAGVSAEAKHDQESKTKKGKSKTLCFLGCGRSRTKAVPQRRWWTEEVRAQSTAAAVVGGHTAHHHPQADTAAHVPDGSAEGTNTATPPVQHPAAEVGDEPGRSPHEAVGSADGHRTDSSPEVGSVTETAHEPESRPAATEDTNDGDGSGPLLSGDEAAEVLRVTEDGARGEDDNEEEAEKAARVEPRAASAGTEERPPAGQPMTSDPVGDSTPQDGEAAGQQGDEAAAGVAPPPPPSAPAVVEASGSVMGEERGGDVPDVSATASAVTVNDPEPPAEEASVKERPEAEAADQLPSAASLVADEGDDGRRVSAPFQEDDDSDIKKSSSISSSNADSLRTVDVDGRELDVDDDALVGQQPTPHEQPEAPGEGAAAAAAPLEKLVALLVYVEEPPRYYAWDAEPPKPVSHDDDDENNEDSERQRTRRLEAHLHDEATSAARAAQRALRQALADMVVHPPRQCIFVEVHGLQDLTKRVLCPRFARAAGTEGRGPCAGATPTTDEVWRGDRYAPLRPQQPGVWINGIDTPQQYPQQQVPEDPQWVEARLALYTHDRQHLVAAGSVFALPANEAALQCSRGYPGRDGPNAFGGRGGLTVAGARGRDSWSDLLVFQVEDPQPHLHSLQQDGSGDAAAAVSAPSLVDDDRESVYRDGSHSHVRSLSVDTRRSAASDFNTAAFYLQLEERRERWVAAATAAEVEEPMGTEHEASAPLQSHVVEVGESRRGVDAEEGAEGEAVVSQYAGQEHDDWRESGEESVDWRTASDNSEQLGSTVPANRPSLAAGFPLPEVHGTPEASHPSPLPDSTNAQGENLRLEESWEFVAVSSPLPAAALRRHALDAPGLSVTLSVPAAALRERDASRCSSMPQSGLTLPCRVRWATEPPLILPDSHSSLADTDTASARLHLCSAQDGRPHTAAWSALGTAIAQYERVCRGGGGCDAEEAAPHSPDGQGKAGAAARAAAPPLTVLWDTLPFAATTAGARAVRDSDGWGASAHTNAPSPLSSPAHGRWRGAAPEVGTVMGGRPALLPLRPTVCSAVVRCSAAVLLRTTSPAAHRAGGSGLAETLSSTYCVPTSLSVTGGLNGFVAEVTPSRQTPAAGGLEGCTPVMRYDAHFHALLAREEAPSLVLTVHAAASAGRVFGFAEWNPFERAEEEGLLTGGGVGGGGVTDLWLPLFAPCEPALTAADAQERRHASLWASVGTVEHHSASATTATAGDGKRDGNTEHEEKRKGLCGGMMLVGWLHCDVEAFFFPSLHEAAMHELWSGPSHSLLALSDAAAAATPGGGQEWCDAAVHDDRDEQNAIVDICVMEAAGLRPLEQRFGVPRPPAPLRWSVQGGVAAAAEVPAGAVCTSVYCEMVVVQRGAQSKGVGRPRAGTSAAAAAAAHEIGSLTLSRNLGDDLNSFSHFSALPSAREGLWSVSPSATGEHHQRCQQPQQRGAALLPVTAAVSQTNRPRWQHTFRCGAATLSSLRLRVFDRAASRSRSTSPDGTQAKPSAPGRGGSAAGAAQAQRSVLLGTATLSPWMLRTLRRQMREGAAPEGSAWLPLLWTAPTNANASAAAGGGGGRLQHAFFPAVSNGFVLVQWRRVVPQFASPLPRAVWPYVSITQRRLADRPSASSRARAVQGAAGHGFASASSRTRAVLRQWPAQWHQPHTAQAPPLDWMSPELAPWLCLHRIRLQWPWIQHVLRRRGGHARLTVSYLTSTEEYRTVDHYLLVPLRQLVRVGQGGGSGEEEGRPRRLCRGGRARAVASAKFGGGGGCSMDGDGDGVFCLVSASALSSQRMSTDPTPFRPFETWVSLPACRRAQFSVSWYPNATPFPHSCDSGTGGGDGERAVAATPQLLGDGVWQFPVSGTQAAEGLGDGSTAAAAAEEDEQQEEEAAWGAEGDGGGDDVARATQPVLHRFFVSHEADIRLVPAQGDGEPRSLAGGVLRCRLASLPRLRCASWGTPSDGAKAKSEREAEKELGMMRGSQSGGTDGLGARWTWPEVGTPATLRMQVHNLVWFEHTDEAAAAALAGSLCVAVGELGAEAEAQQAVSSSSVPAVGDEEVCWTAAGTLPDHTVPRLLYRTTNSSSSDTRADGSVYGGSGTDARSLSQSSRQPSPRTTSLSAAAGGGDGGVFSGHDARSAASGTAWGSRASGLAGAGTEPCATPAVELRWAPRRFTWVTGDLPTTALWVLSKASTSSQEGEAAAETVLGSVRMPQLSACAASSGVLWLPLFKAYAAPAPSLSSAANHETAAANASTADNTSPLEEQRSDESLHNARGGEDGGAATSFSPHGPLAAAAEAAARSELPPPPNTVVKHVGFAAVSYAHNFLPAVSPPAVDDKAGVVRTALADTEVTSSQVLVVQAGPLRRRHAPAGTASQTVKPHEAHREEGGGVEEVKSSDGSLAVPPLRFPSVEGASRAHAAAAALRPLSPLSDDVPLAGEEEGESGSVDVLLGFQAYHVTLPARLADATSETKERDDEGSQDSGGEAVATAQLAVFPWPAAPQRASAAQRMLRVQARLSDGHSDGVVAGTALCLPDSSAAGCQGGVQWVPLIAHGSELQQGQDGAGYTAGAAEGDRVLGELLLRWRVAAAPTAVERRIRAVTWHTESESWRQLVHEYCGGPGTTCTYALLSLPDAAATASVVSAASAAASAAAAASTRASSAVRGAVDAGHREGRLASNGGSGLWAASKVREWASGTRGDGGVLTFSAAAAALAAALHTTHAVDRGLSVHPCVYLLLDRLHLQCSSAQLNTLFAAMTTSTSSKAQQAVRLEVQLRWPAEWLAEWLHTTAAAVPQEKAMAGESTLTGTRDGNSGVGSLSNQGTPSFTVWVDVAEGMVALDSASPALPTSSSSPTWSSAHDQKATQHTLRCRSLSVCVPLPASQQILRVLGLPGLAARLSMTLRLFVLRDGADLSGMAATASPSMTCVGVGHSQLTYPRHSMHGTTPLHPPSATGPSGSSSSSSSRERGAGEGDSTAPLLLVWRARVLDSLPLHTTPALAAGVEGGPRPDDNATLSCDSSLSSSASGVSHDVDEAAQSAGTRLHARQRTPAKPALVRFTVKRAELAGVDVSLACGTAQRHRHTLPPASVSMIVLSDTAGGSGRKRHSSGDNNDERRGFHDDGPVSDPAAEASSAPHNESSVTLLTPSLSVRTGCGGISNTDTSPPTTQRQQQQQRYSWTADVCVQSHAHVAFYVRVPEAVMRAARGEEVWRGEGDDDDDSETGGVALPHSNGIVATAQSPHELVGKALYRLDTSAWEGSRQQQQGEHPGVRSDGPISRPPEDREEVVLDLESPALGRWVGRLWLQTEWIAAADFMPDARNLFLTTRACVELQQCTGIVAGDAGLAGRVEATYRTLRERVVRLHAQTGTVPLRLRREVREVEAMRRQLQHAGGQRNGSAADDEMQVRLVCALTCDGIDSSASQRWTSTPFTLPSALSTLQQQQQQQQQQQRMLTCVTGAAAEEEEPSGGVTQRCSGGDLTVVSQPPPVLSVPVDTVVWRSGAAASPISPTARTGVAVPLTATTLDIRLVESGSAGGSGGAVLAGGRLALSLDPQRALCGTPSWMQCSSVPLTLSAPHKADSAEGRRATSAQQSVVPRVSTLSTANEGSVAVTTTWTVGAALGDTYITCLLVRAPAGRTRGGGGGTGYCNWALRWVYVFEASASPNQEHWVEVPLLARPALAEASLEVSSGRRLQGERRSAPQHSHASLSNTTHHHHSSSSSNNSGCTGGWTQYWSGATTQLPRVGAAGATIRRVELIEVTPVRDAQAETPSRSSITTCVATHTWSVEDELRMSTLRRSAHATGNSAAWKLSFGASGSGGHRAARYDVVCAVFTSNAVTCYAAQRLAKQVVVAATATAGGEGGPEGAVDVRRTGGTAVPHHALPATHPRLRAQGDVNAAALPPSAVKAAASLPLNLTAVATAAAAAGATPSPCYSPTGGVVLRSMVFRCSDATLTAANLEIVTTISCKVIQGVAPRQRDDGGAASDVVLEAGRAASIVVQRRAPSPVVQNCANTSAMRTGEGTVPMREQSVDSSTHALVTAVWCGDSGSAGEPTSRASGLPGTAPNLLRIDVPSIPPVAEASPLSQQTDSAGVVDVPFYLEVGVAGGSTSVTYVSDTFSARSVLSSDATAAGQRSTADVAGGNNETFGSTSLLHWTAPLTLHLAGSSPPLPTQPSTPVDGAASCDAVMELCWGVDVLGIQPARATVLGGTLQLRSQESSGSDTQLAAANQQRKKRSSSDTTLQQLSACAAWTDFLMALDARSRRSTREAELRHWRCQIVGIEVADVELPRWVSSASTAAAAADGKGEWAASASCLTTLLAQLSFPAKRVAAAEAEEVRKSKEMDGVQKRKRAAHRRARGAQDEEEVLGVARTAAISVVPSSGSGWGPQQTPPFDRAGLSVPSQRPYAQETADATISDTAVPRVATYNATFAPLSWSIALPDMLRHSSRSGLNAQTGAATEVGGGQSRAAAEPSLSVWQLLTPPSAAAVAGEQLPYDTQAVYELGAAQLSRLLQEGALYLVQVLGRWCAGACTRDERDELLSAAACCPTHWMPLCKAEDSPPRCTAHPYGGDDDGDSGSISGPRVRLYYSFVFDQEGGGDTPARVPAGSHTPMLEPPVPAYVPAPPELADAVYCVQIDDVQLRYHEGEGSSSSKEGRQAVRGWLGRLQMRLRGVRRPQRRHDTADGTSTTTVTAEGEEKTLGEGQTRLAPLPAPVDSAGLPRGDEATSLSAAAVAVAGPPVPTPIPVPAPVPVPVPVATTAASTQAEEAEGSPHQEAHDSVSGVPVSVPLLTTTSCFCWQPESTESDDDDASNGFHSRYPGDATAHPAEALFLEVDIVWTGDESSQAVSSEIVVGRCTVCVGSASGGHLAFDQAEQRLETGWRMDAPMLVRVPVALLSSKRVERGGTASAAARSDDEPSEPCFLSFACLAFTAPSWAQVTALQSARRRETSRRLRTLAKLRQTEAHLLSSIVAPTLHQAQRAEEEKKKKAAVTAPTAGAGSTLRQLCAALTAHPYRVLRAPPAVYQPDSFALLDAVPPSDAGRTAPTLHCGLESLWWVRCGANGGATTMWLVSGAAAEKVRVPQWTLLPSLADATHSQSHTLWSHISSSHSSERHRRSLAGHAFSSPSAGRLLIEERARLRVEWRAERAGECPAAMLAGLLGGAAVRYSAASGDACLWVSGGMRCLAATSAPPTVTNARAAVYTSAGPSFSSLTAPPPNRQLPRSTSSRVGVAGANTAPVPRTATGYYQLYTSHLLCCQRNNDGGSSSSGRGSDQLWRCETEVTTSASAQEAAASTRAFHTATLVDGRIWLMGGWCACSQGSSTAAAAAAVPVRVAAADGVVAALTSTRMPPASTSVRDGGAAGLVERRRREVRSASVTELAAPATSPSSSPTPSASVAAGGAAALLCWCEAVSCVRVMHDGTPAPPVNVAASLDATCEEDDRAHVPPRVACHVAAACGRRHVLLFGGLTPRDAAPHSAVATAAVHAYDTVTGAWSSLSPPASEAQPWPMARYGHSIAPVPGTEGMASPSYLVFGGAVLRQTTGTRAAEHRQTPELVPAEEVLWLWTPCLDAEATVRCVWRRVQVPLEVPSPLLGGRLLAQLAVFAAADVVSSLMPSAPVDTRRLGGGGGGGASTAAACVADCGLTSMVLCVAGGMVDGFEPSQDSGDVDDGKSVSNDDSSEDGALAAFRQYVEPWLRCPAVGASTVLLTAMGVRSALP